MCRDPEPPVRTDVGHADELHIVLHPDSGSHSFADDAVAVQGNTYLCVLGRGSCLGRRVDGRQLRKLLTAALQTNR